MIKLTPTKLGKAITPWFRNPPHIKKMEADILEFFDNPKINRMIFAYPVRHGKSTMCCFLMPLWRILINPDEHILIASRSKTFSCEWVSQIRNILAQYGKQFGVELDPKKRTETHIKIKGHRGEIRAIGVGSGCAGYTSTLTIIDDVYEDQFQANSPTQRKKIEDWLAAEITNRATPMEGREPKILMCGSLRHPSDISAQLVKSSIDLPDTKKWYFKKYAAIQEDGTALWKEQFDIPRLMDIKREYELQGQSYLFESLYQSNACADPSAIEYPSEYFEDVMYDHDIEPLYTFGAIDPATGKGESGDYSCAIYMILDKEGRCWIDDSLLLRCPISEFEDRCCDFFFKHNPDAILVETNIETGFSQHLPDLMWKKHQQQLYINTVHHTKAKEIRIRRALSPLLYQRKLKFKDIANNRLGLQQIKELWSGTNDDFPDAIAMAVELMNSFLGTQKGEL